MAAAAPAALDCWGALEEQALTQVVSTALGRPVRLAGFETTAVAYEPGSPATGALLRVAGATADGQPWSVFLKVLQHPRHWPRLGLLPAEIRQPFLDQYPWRGELAAWEPGFADRLPAGMRLPRLYRLTELGDDRLAVWMEDVPALDDAWEPPRFARAARALGGLAARRSDPALLAASGFPAGAGLRSYSRSRVELSGLPLLEQDEVWSHPLVAGAVDDRLRDDLRTLGARVPELLDGMDRLPQALPHGDASPQNLLVPADDPGTFVAIDVSFQTPHAVGFDLGQLLVGLTHAGQLPAAALPEVHAVLVPAFTDGLLAHGAAPPATRSPGAMWPAWPSGPASPRCRSSASRSHRPRPWPPPSVSAPP
ncbi:MAG: aminoglycoside phosphotransferase [Actinomycetia bacterium]|nr:aminoglycoside phosphotransferase [Actinomycetes bacterium]